MFAECCVFSTARTAASDSPAPQILEQRNSPASGTNESPAEEVAAPREPVIPDVMETSESPGAEITAATEPGTPEVMESSGSPTSSESSDDDATEPAMPALDIEEMRAREAAEKTESSHWHSVTNVVLSEDTIEETQDNVALPAGITQSIKDVSVVVFTVDSDFAETAMRALSGDRNTILATSLVKVAQAVETHQAGVLVTDFTTNSNVLQKMIGALKQYMPELVTIVVSSGRDTTDMINLINYGQVFRYVLKPIEASDLKTDVNAAAVRCLYLLSNPESVKRHQVIEAPSPTDSSSTLNRFLGRIRKIQSERPNPTDVAAK